MKNIIKKLVKDLDENEGIILGVSLDTPLPDNKCNHEL